MWLSRQRDAGAKPWDHLLEEPAFQRHPVVQKIVRMDCEKVLLCVKLGADLDSPFLRTAFGEHIDGLWDQLCWWTRGHI